MAPGPTDYITNNIFKHIVIVSIRKGYFIHAASRPSGGIA